MDRNSAIGLTLIGALLLAYFYFFSPTPQPATQKPVTTEVLPSSGSTDTQQEKSVAIDSVLAASYGDLASSLSGEESLTQIETEDLKVSFSNKGGVIKELELKKYKTYSQEALKLVTPENSLFSLTSTYQGKEIDLYTLYYQLSKKNNGDTTELQFSINLSDGSKIAQVYKIPNKGYEIGYQIESTGFDKQLTGDALTFNWVNILRPIEKDLSDSRINTTINYYSESDGFDELGARSTDTETETFNTPLKWVAVKEKFFLSSFISKGNFSGGEVSTSLNSADSSVVKRANVKLFIPKQSLADGKSDFKFYFGPNNYKTIGTVADDFTKNVYLGWKPVYWINKFVIFPVFHFLTSVINNYGVIIIILVLLLKLVLLPLSYKSYLSMAKMRVLKPELDEIKERVGEDMTKVQQEQMKLYQQVGVNPISGCIPVLLQMPLILAMFYLFPASIELRQEHFLWAEDLSTYDSIIRLPFTMPFGVGSHISLFTVLMTAATLVSTWQNNQMSAVTGPMKSMGYIMPLVFFFILNSFSAGLTFYYFISTTITFVQQAIIKRFVDEDKIKAIMEENRKKIAASGGSKSKFMSKLENAMKASEEARRKSSEERANRKNKK